MTPALLATLLFGTLAVAALLYAMQVSEQAETLRQERDALRVAVNRHLREGIIYGHEVSQLERRNRWLEQHHRVVMLRWWKRRQYRTLSSWKVSGGAQ